MKNYVFSQHELLNESERAFENHEFKVYLQPKYDIRTTKVMGAESLVRWQHPEKGLIFPPDFHHSIYSFNYLHYGKTNIYGKKVVEFYVIISIRDIPRFLYR